MTAIYALELLIGKVFKIVSQKEDNDMETIADADKQHEAVFIKHCARVWL